VVCVLPRQLQRRRHTAGGCGRRMVCCGMQGDTHAMMIDGAAGMVGCRVMTS
jgi:hypothetical protein